MRNITIKLVLGSRPLANGNYKVFLRIIKDRKKKEISIGLETKREHFVNEQFSKSHPNWKIENELLLKIKSKAYQDVRELQLIKPNFTFEDFDKKFREGKGMVNNSVVDFFDIIIDEMNRAGRISNAKAYKDTRTSIIKFKGKKIIFQDIDFEFLDKYEVFLRETGSKDGGVAFRMRELRALFNKAIKRNLVDLKYYPFIDYKISKLKPENKKIAITVDDYLKFKEVDLSHHPHLIEAYNYFLFSLYTRGMNFHDMMLLRWENIRNGRIYYIRSKTKGKINQEIIPPAQEILDYYKNQNRPTPYVFPILLKENLTPIQVANRKHKVASRYNRKLKVIARMTEISPNITTYVARHSFATILKMQGTPIEKITEMMGHRDVGTTIAYLKEFQNEDLDIENRKFTEL